MECGKNLTSIASCHLEPVILGKGHDNFNQNHPRNPHLCYHIARTANCVCYFFFLTQISHIFTSLWQYLDHFCPGTAKSLNNTDCKFAIGILEGIWKETCTMESIVSAIADNLDLM